MHSDSAADVKKKVRSYITVFAMLMVFTVITVAASRFHLTVPVGITVALIIAGMKGSMVASVFMHLSHEKPWVYGVLILTVVFFVVLLFVPVFTVMDSTGTATHAAVAEHGGH
jgi:cytochrome c oxidase subunit 4